MIKNVDLICCLNFAVSPSERLRQEEQRVNLRTILRLHNWPTEDPEQTPASSETVSSNGSWTDGKAHEEENYQRPQISPVTRDKARTRPSPQPTGTHTTRFL